jgi:hypothetical protein
VKNAQTTSFDYRAVLNNAVISVNLIDRRVGQLDVSDTVGLKTANSDCDECDLENDRGGFNLDPFTGG